ncbi:MAG TPA: di-heme oxidoredictase family protein [Steroidobacteraceae bacterium]|nr:di-heme oxidoredictase family protein [Steroidobacteraceae bacterium]
MCTFGAATRRILRGSMLWLPMSLAVLAPAAVLAQAQDPGVRQAATDGGPPVPLTGISSNEMAYFQDGVVRFNELDMVSGGVPPAQGNGLGPRFNSNQCSGCHSQPYVGGSSPAVNPLFTVFNASGATNQMPWFEAKNGPVREARFVSQNGVPDGGVHDLFVVTGRTDLTGTCTITQPSFLPAGNPVTGRGGNPNIVFRIPTPTLGAGLIEAIPDSTILANAQANSDVKQRHGVHGHPNAVQGGTVNRSANDGTITRFGWKAQNKSLLMFAGEAYNVEMGISNQLFPQERDETPGCEGTATPNDTDNFPPPGQPVVTTAVLSDIEGFANFMRMLAPPTPAAPTASTQHGSALFTSTGCALCHTPTMTTGKAIASGSYINPSMALSNQPANLFSDLLVHHMGVGLADGITQGAAGPDEFRTAPLWGVGQRVYFLHDGRTSDLMHAIRQHASPGSEANQVVMNFFGLSPQDQQDMLNFLRSL